MQTCFDSFSAVSTNFLAIETVLETARRPLHVPDAMPARSAQKIDEFFDSLFTFGDGVGPFLSCIQHSMDTMKNLVQSSNLKTFFFHNFAQIFHEKTPKKNDFCRFPLSIYTSLIHHVVLRHSRPKKSGPHSRHVEAFSSKIWLISKLEMKSEINFKSYQILFQTWNWSKFCLKSPQYVY